MIKSLLGSKKFIASTVGVIVALVAKLGIELDTEAVALVISPILAYILGQGVADHGKGRVENVLNVLNQDASREAADDTIEEELLP